MGKGSIVWEVLQEFDELTHYGESKRDVRIGIATYTDTPYKDVRSPWIHSRETREEYKDWCVKFALWVRPTLGVAHLRDVRPEHVAAWLESRKANGDKPASLRTEASAVAKMLDCSYKDFPVELPPVTLAGITRGRVSTEANEAWKALHPDIVRFVEATGLRKGEFWAMRASAIVEGRGGLRIEVDGKGGKHRTIVPLQAAWAREIIREFRDRAIAQGGPDCKLVFWLKKPHAYNEHSDRARYAWLKYCELAHPGDRARAQLWVRRNGEVLDKPALRVVSRNLGHNRIDVVVREYWYRRE